MFHAHYLSNLKQTHRCGNQNFEADKARGVFRGVRAHMDSALQSCLHCLQPVMCSYSSTSGRNVPQYCSLKCGPIYSKHTVNLTSTRTYVFLFYTSPSTSSTDLTVNSFYFNHENSEFCVTVVAVTEQSVLCHEVNIDSSR